jgi:hypothetical protein
MKIWSVFKTVCWNKDYSVKFPLTFSAPVGTIKWKRRSILFPGSELYQNRMFLNCSVGHKPCHATARTYSCKPAPPCFCHEIAVVTRRISSILPSVSQSVCCYLKRPQPSSHHQFLCNKTHYAVLISSADRTHLTSPDPSTRHLPRVPVPALNTFWELNYLAGEVCVTKDVAPPVLPKHPFLLTSTRCHLTCKTETASLFVDLFRAMLELEFQGSTTIRNVANISTETQLCVPQDTNLQQLSCERVKRPHL